MTVYARSDICTVNVGPAHGGCGQLHRRPSGAMVSLSGRGA